MKRLDEDIWIRAFKDFILASKFKVDPRGQRSFFEKVAQFNEKHCWKGLVWIYRMVYELEPFKDFIWPPMSQLTSEVKGQFYQFIQNWPINLCAKFGEATVSLFEIFLYFPT